MYFDLRHCLLCHFAWSAACTNWKIPHFLEAYYNIRFIQLVASGTATTVVGEELPEAAEVFSSSWQESSSITLNVTFFFGIFKTLLACFLFFLSVLVLDTTVASTTLLGLLLLVFVLALLTSLSFISAGKVHPLKAPLTLRLFLLRFLMVARLLQALLMVVQPMVVLFLFWECWCAGFGIMSNSDLCCFESFTRTTNQQR